MNPPNLNLRLKSVNSNYKSIENFNSVDLATHRSKESSTGVPPPTALGRKKSQALMLKREISPEFAQLS